MTRDDRLLKGVFDEVRRMVDAPDDVWLGEIAVESGVVTIEQLQECLADGRPLAQELVARGLIDADGLTRLLREQTRRLEGVPDLERYDVLERIGAGGAAVVYRAFDRELQRPVALKVLRELPGEAERERFRREARAAAALNHPNVVAVHDVGTTDERPYLVMELVEGTPLDAARADGAFLELLTQTARGVGAAHDRGIVHRDLKPGNVLVTRDGTAKVSDFGLALWSDSARLTRTGATVGTPLYMAPEQVKGDAITTRTDVYALGAMLYEALTGRPPHTGKSAADLYARIVRDDPVKPRRLAPKAPAALESVALKALAKDPAARYADAHDFADDLQRYREGRPVVGRPQRFGRRAKRVSAAAVAIAGIAVAIVLFARDGVPEALRTKRERIETQLNAWPEDPAPVRRHLDQVDRLIRGGLYEEAGRRLDRGGMTLLALNKRRAIREGIGGWVRAGRDPAAIHALVKKAETHIVADDLPQAHALLDRALQGLRGNGDDDVRPADVQRKLSRVRNEMRRWQSTGRDPRDAGRMMQRFEPLVQAGRLADADELLDEVLRVLAR